MPTPSRDIPNALPAPPVPGADRGWALFLDVDGTLLDFALRPDAVRVEDGLHDDLAALRERLSGALALLSGRTLDQLDELFDWRNHAAAGLHGAQLRDANGHTLGIDDDGVIAALHTDATRAVADMPGVLLEDKRHAMALHYRNAPAQGEAVQRLARDLARRAGDGYTLQPGNHVVELKPAGADKGRALAVLMATSPFRDRRPWMLGDDLTDEHAFEEVNVRGGISVLVGARRPTCARHALDGPAAVRAWLAKLAAAGDDTPREEAT